MDGAVTRAVDGCSGRLKRCSRPVDDRRSATVILKQGPATATMLDASIGERAAALGEARCQVHPIGLCFLSSCLLLFFFFLIFFFPGYGFYRTGSGEWEEFQFRVG